MTSMHLELDAETQQTKDSGLTSGKYNMYASLHATKLHLLHDPQLEEE